MSIFHECTRRKLLSLILVGLLLVNTSLFAAMINPVLGAPSLSLKWSRSLGPDAITMVGPLAADVNGDGKMEIVVTGGSYQGDTDGFVTVLNGNTGSTIWQASPGGVGAKSPFEIADINNDGKLEIVVTGLYPVVLRGDDGRTIWTNSAVSSYNLWSPVCDIDADGYSEIFVSSGRGPQQGYDYFTKLSYDGKVLAQNPTSWHPCWGGMTIGDPNSDGNFILYQGDRSYGYRTSPSPEEPYIYGEWGVRALDAATLTPLWNDSSILCSSHPPILADVDKDGILDVIATYQGTSNGGLIVLNASNGVVSTAGGKIRKSLSLGLPSHSEPTVYDIDGDGNLEIITCRDTTPKIWDLYTWKLDAVLPIVCSEPPKVGDVNGDGAMEIIAPSGGSIYIYDKNFNQVEVITGLSGARPFTLLQDVDGDGYNELVVSSSQGYVYCYDTPTLAPTPRVRSECQFYSERHCGAAEYVPPPAPLAPTISQPNPSDKSTNVPIALSQLSFNLADYQHDLVDYTVTTSPDIGSGSSTDKPNGQYSIPVSNLNYATTYSWTVTATDGLNPRTKTFTFTTQPMPPWWSTAWPYRRTISVDHTKVSGDQTNFPVVIDLVDGGLASKAQLDGDDFVFTDANHVKLIHEIEKYDPGTGHLIAWVKIPFLSSSVDTSVIMYYGNPTCENQQTPLTVWDTDNVLVLHLDETHECRMWGMIANTLPHDVVLNNLISAPSSLKVLGGANDDGWGLVYYAGTAPVVARGPLPANTDPNFDLAANALADSNAWVGVGHVRARSQGGLPPWGNPHPFMRYKGGKWWAFAHNGNVNKDILRTLIGPAYLAANPPTYGANWDDDSNIVDSDLYALFVLKCIEANNWDVTLGVAQAIKEMTDAGGDSGGANFLLTNGETLWGYRRGNTLWYYYQATSPQYSTIASQPPDTSLPGWVQLSDYNFITIAKNSPSSVITDIRQKYPTPILVDSEFSNSTDSADLRNNATTQDWYESRNDLPTLLYLDTNNVGGDTSKKAGFTANSTKNAYLTQGFSSAQTGTFTVQWDIYVDSILDISGTDRAGWMMIGDDFDNSGCPNNPATERFVYLAFYKNGGGISGTMDFVAMNSTSFTAQTVIASGLNLKQWYTIRVMCNMTAKTYDVYVDGVLKATVGSAFARTSVTHISFAQWNDGAGAFFVDNVHAPARNRYKLAIGNVGNGSVDMNPGESSYLPATVVTLTANPALNWFFSGWSGDLTDDENPATITVDTNKAVAATFTSQGYTLSVSIVGGGSVSQDPDLASYPDGSVVTLTATPTLGWSFSGWSGALSGSANPATITMDSNKVVVATFTQNQYTLTVNIVGSGSVTKSPDKTTYTYGEIVTLTASGNPSWLFSKWSGDLAGSASPATITIDSNKVVTATFIQGYTLSVDIIGGGSVSKDPDQASYVDGSVVNLTATPTLGWSFSGWSGALSGNANPATITIDGDKVVTATFTQNQYTLTINIVGGGSVTKNPNKATYIYGETVTLTATADPGWAFSEFSCGCDNPFTMTVDGDKVVTATFTQVYTLTIGIVGSGSVARDPDLPSYVPDSLVTLTAAPAVGWSFSGWSGALSGNANPATIAVDGDKVVVATFTRDQYTLTVNIVGSGSVTKNPNKATYTYGETVTLTASPTVGWSFFQWSVDLSGSTNPTTITVDGDKVVGATFVQGTVCFDSTLNGNNGALYGGVTQGIAGKIDGAYRFDGTTGYIQVPHSNTLSGFAQGFTVSFWLKLEDTAKRQMLLNKYNTGAGQRSWYIEYQNHVNYGKVIGFFASQDGTAYKEWYATFVPTAGTWYYVTVVWQSNTVPKFYINGAQVTTRNTGTIASIFNNVGVPLLIGRCAYDATRYFKGSLDEIRISNSARTAGWILTCYNSQKDPSTFYRVGTEESLPPAPSVFDPNPANGATNVPVATTELSFSLTDYQNDAMTYDVSTTPNIGGGSATGVHNGRYSAPVSGLQYSTTYTWYVDVTDGTHETDATYTFTTSPRWLVDSELTDSVDSVDLRNNGTGQDWYESRNDVPALLSLDTSNVGGDSSKKAGFTASSSGNAYLTQEFGTAQTGTFTVQWDIYVDSILDISSPDRAGFMLLGSDLDGQKGPSSADSERFVFLAFFKNGGGNTGTMDLVAMSSFSANTTVASGLNMKQWYTIKVIANVPAGAYDVYVDGALKATKTATTKLASITHISFAQWNDGAGAFYVDNVLSPAQDRYRLTLITAGSGSIAKSPAEATYASGTIVTLTATPASQWYFDRWSGGVSGNANPITVKMDSDKVVTAIFTQECSLTVNIVGSGSVVKNPDQASYTPGTVVTLTATPALGWSFSGWSGDLTGNANPATITMSSSKVVTATFTQKQYALTINIVGSGAVTKNPNQPTYAEGAVVALMAAPATGWSFTAWTGALTGSTNPATITMTSDRTVTATFTQDQYTLTVNVDGGGSVAKTPNQPTYTYGTVVQLTATPEPSYAFSHWTGDISSNLNPESVSMTGNKAVTAVFVWTQTNWWNTAWQYRRTITIDRSRVITDQTDFPVLVDLTDTGLTLKAQTDGDDFVFTDANQAKLSHEIELYVSGAGHLVAWVKIPLLSSTADTVLYMYYGNPSSANQQDTAAVWDVSNRLVLHLDEKTGIHYDSTVNGNNGTPYNGVAQGASGKIDGADTFDGVNDYVQVPHSNTLSGFTQALTISFWLRLDDVSRRQTILNKYNTGAGQRSWYIEYQNHVNYGKVIGFFASQDGTAYKEWYASFSPVAGTWYYMTVVWQSNTVPKFFINGVQVTTRNTGTITSIYNNVGVPLHIGRCTYDATRYLKGGLDEIRVSNPARSASWILTCYNSQSNPSTFYQIGTEEKLEAPRYTLTITIVGQGSVTKNPDQITYVKDTVVQLTANAVPGWTFSGWSGDLTGTNNPTSITMTGNKAVTATFTQDQYTLGVSLVGNGQVTKTPNQANYTYGTVVTLTAVPIAGWTFSGWSGDLSGITSPTTVNMTGNKAVTATFTQLEYTLTINISPPEGGSAAISPLGPYHYGDTVQLTAVPATDWYFAGWSGALSGSTNPATITMDSNKSVTAAFIKIGYTLNISVVGNGSVAITPNQPTYNPGSVVNLTATPTAGWSFTGWSGGLTGTANPGTVTMDSNKSITATFTQNQYTLSITLDGNGQVTKNPDQANYTYGASVTLTATADPGWTFSGWSGALSGSTNPTTITMDSNKGVTATFTANQYNLTINTIGSGSVTKIPDQPTYTYNTVVTLTAAPQSGWLFSQWTGDLTGSTNPATVNMTGNKVVNATFIRLLVDSEFNDSADDVALRANSPGQDWYESRQNVPTLLFLDTNNIGGNTGKKAGFTASSSGNAYLSQEFISPQTGTFSVQWDIYVDSILDISGTDATGFMMIGDDSTPASPGPNYPTAERFVYMAFYKNGGGTSGSMQLVCRQRGVDTLTTIATLNLDQWYTIRVLVNVAAGTYDVYVDGSSMGTYTSRNAKTNVTHISFAQWNDGAGAFYVDNVHSLALDRYKLAVSTVGSGSVTKVLGESTYVSGSVVTLTATPASGWTFSAWSGDLSGSVSPATVTMDSNKIITATFAQNQYTLTINVAGIGSVTKSPDKTSYNDGETVTLTAVPSAGWSFTVWSGDLSGNTNPTTVNMTGNKEVTATFTQLEYTLTVTAVPIEGGSVTVSPLGPYHYGDTVQLTAVPTTDWTFSGWDGDLTGSENPATITILGNTAVTAYFSQNERTLTINIVGNGQVSKDPNKATYPDGTVVTLTATADPGWTFAGWSIDLTGNDNPATITMNRNKVVTATFAQLEYTLTVTSSPTEGGSVTLDPAGPYHYGDAVQLTAIPAADWSFSGWSGDLTGSANPVSITMDGNKVVTATFTKTGYTLNVNVVGSGSVSKSPDQATYAPGTVVTLNAAPALGWSFSGWSGDLSGSTNPSTITMDANKAVTATFTENQYTLDVAIVGNGQVSKNPNLATYTYGTVVTLTATADLGWSFNGWSGDFSGSSNPAPITMDANKAVTATFTQNQYTLAVNTVGSGSVTKSPDQPTYTYNTSVTLTATPQAGWLFSQWTGDLTGSTNPATIAITGNKVVTATFIRLLVDSEFSDSVDNATLRTNGSGQDWYESRGQNASLLTLDTADIGGNSGKKARLTGGTNAATDNIYLTQEFISPQTGIFSAQWDIYVDQILDISSPDRSGWMLIGDDSTSGSGPNAVNGERFVYMAFFKNGGGTSGTMDLVAVNRTGSFTSHWVIASGLSLKQWYTIKVVVNVPGGTYDVYVDGILQKAGVSSRNAKTSLTHISFAQWNDGAGTFYVDNVHSLALDRYKLAVNAAGSGSVTKTPGESTYAAGSVVTLTATPASGWSFAGWSGDLSGSVSPASVTMDSGKMITATFTQNQYALTANVAGSGSVTKSPDKTTYNEGEIVTLTAVPSVGWSFDSWSGDLAGGTNPATITMTGNKMVTATFTQNQYALSVTVVGSGSVGKNPDKATYTYGETVALTASVSVGYTFSGWSGDLTGTQSPVDIVITGDKAVTATFTQDQYTLSIETVGSGAVSKIPEQATYTYGSSVQLTATADAGWTFSYWSGDLTGSENPAFVTIDGSKTITATFTQNQYTLTVNLDGSGSVDKSPNKATYTYGEEVILTANAVVGWSFSEWSGALTGNTSPATVTMDSDETVTATFTRDQYTVTVTTDGSGSVSKNPDQATYTYGESVQLTASPEVGWSFTYWSGDLTGSESPATINVTGDMTITAHFGQNQYSLTVNVEGSGSVSRDPDQASYEYGTIVTLTATPELGWSFSGWSGDLSGSESPTTLSIDASKTVTAAFTQNEYTLDITVVGSGFVTKNPSQLTYLYGDVVQLTATAADGWSFSGWSGDLSGTVDPESITMTGNRDVTATFAQNEYTLTVTIVGTGSVTKEPEKTTYVYGDTVTLTALPGVGYTFAGWSGDLIDTANPVTVTIDSGKLITATFTQNEYTLIVIKIGNGVVTRSPEQTTYTHGTTVTMTATADPGWTFSGWSGDLSGIESPADIVMDETKTATATFTQNEYVLTVTASPLSGGSVSKTPDQATYHYDDVVQLTATSSAGYSFSGWSGSLVGNPTSVTVTGDTTATATFTQIEYTLAVSASPIDGGSVSKSPDSPHYHYNDVVELTATPSAGYSFSGWSGGLAGNPTSVTIAGDTVVTASFTQIQYTLTITTVGSGSVSRNPNQATYTYGASVQLTANPDAGWSFSGWSGDLSGANNPESISITANKVVTATFTSINYNDVAFDSSFETGNLKNVQFQSGDSLGNRFYTGEQDHTTVSGMVDKHWWFYFSMDNVASKTVTIQLVNNEVADMSTRWAEIEPVYSFNNVNWERLPLSNVVVDITGRTFQMTVTLPPSQNTIWLAPLPPYTISLRDALFAEFASSPYLTVSSLGTTPGGQELKVATITDKTYSDANKIKAYVIAMQHSTEVPGGWEADEMIRFLLSNDPTAQAIRRSYIFRIVPIVNVDGVYYGRSRYTPLRDGVQYDLNRWWSYDVSAMPFEVAKIFTDMQAFQPSSFNDIHSTINTEMGSPRDAVTYTWSTGDPTVVAFLNKIHDAGWPDTQRGTSGYACSQVHSRLGVVRSISWENPQDEFITNPGHKLTINDWRDMGKAYAKGVYLDGGEAQATLTADVVGSGSITRDPNQATYSYGTSVQLTAVQNAGWSFDHWSGDLTGNTNPATIVFDGNKAATATFTQNPQTEYTLTVNIVGSGSVTKDPDQATYVDGTPVTLTASAGVGYVFSGWSGDLSGSANPATITMDKSKTVTATFLQILLVDSNFDASVDSADLRTNSTGQDWCESRGQNASLLTLDTADVGGNSGKKARLTGGTIASTDNIYLTQEFISPQTGVFSVQWDIYIDSILDIASPDRSGWMLIGDDSVAGSGPNAANGERFVYMAFFKNGGGTSGTMDLVAVNRTGSFSSHMIVASGLSLKQWYTIKVVVNVTGGNYDVYVDGVFKATVTSRNAKTSLTHISFAQWNDGAGTFYVDNVYSPARSMQAMLASVDSGMTSPTGNYRWMDVANQTYGSSYTTSYNYSQASVTVNYNRVGKTLTGKLIAQNLKPNFAYQFKLAGTPGTADNELIGLAGRWWQEEWNGTAWTNGQNLNDKGTGSSPNPNDGTYLLRKSITDITSPTGLHYRYTGYLLFGYFITDSNGAATLYFETGSCYHVLWKTTQRARVAEDGPLKTVTFDPVLSTAYDVDYPSSTISIFGEWERLPMGSVNLAAGNYNCQLVLTEESFHGTGPLEGNWAAAMSTNISFSMMF